MRVSRYLVPIVLGCCAALLLPACTTVRKLMPVVRVTPRSVMKPDCHDRFVRIDTDVPGVAIHYREFEGSGPNIVLIHGFASSTYTWEDMVAELQRKYGDGPGRPHIWAIDLKGFGWSDKPRKAQYDPFTLADEVILWMNKLGIGQATVVGNSLGGAIALIMAIDHPDRVSRLVLVDAGGYQVRKHEAPSFLMTPFTRLTAPLLFSRLLVREGLESVFYDNRLVTRNRVDEYFDRLRTWGCVRAQAKLVTSLDPDKAKTYEGRLAGITQEALIIWGRDDTWIPLNFGCCFDRALPRSTLSIILQSGHVPQEEKPAEVAGLLYAFLRNQPITAVTCACQE